ncbi:AAA family ATPase [Pontibacillus litoralis]|uniref:Stage V sporulation protein K n=1 Tax=Pontibacillus litoralis JSM 072002 TaxID=1385512 RepID=A0A0A5G8R1_9BACI|nr:AAA family ATPase [Pontibacillus litoralis]KGX87553.1 stage V sporulation protein K [Pontibacillus litoralis JSM 072002]
MKVNEEQLQALNEWNNIQTPPPLSQMDALRVMDAFEHQKEDLEDVTVSRLYTLIAFYRMRQHESHQDDVAKEWVDKAKRYENDNPIILQLEEWLVILSHLQRMEKEQFHNLMVHETDHTSVKRKKLHVILERMEKLEEEWSSHLSLYPSANPSESTKVLINGQDILDQLLNELETFQMNEMNGVNHVSIPTINELLRNLQRVKEDLQAFVPKMVTNEREQDALSQLESMVGLHEVKTYMHRYYHFLKYQQRRKQMGFHMRDEPELHMIISGNPGTGKTTLARLLANIYYELGLLDTKEVIEVNRSHLVGSYVGQSEENTMNYVKQAIGGVLFIDEAYSLKREGQTGNDYGQAVIDTLVSAMTSKEYGDKFAVILAGYPEEMRQFLWSNPGLRSRFPEQNQIMLPDYEIDELLYIGEQTALDNDYYLTEKAVARLQSAIDKQKVDDTFGNARTVKNIVLQAIFQKGAQNAGQENESWLDYMRLEEQDFVGFLPAREEQQSPIEQLNRLIGLQPVKEEVKKLSSFVRMQKQREQEGLPTIPIQLHAVFSGNPGTGKTTVAHIYANILKECGLLKRGHVVVTSRSDLVAGYVGQTAMKTKKKIREALGGVLFIDEAYALFQSSSNDFGKEAVDTLVDEMTKHNENLVVILAGYKQEMRQLINSNPGLSSRFKKFFHFPDYTPDELVEMVKLIAESYQYTFSEQAISYLQQQFEKFHTNGNGRFVKNLVDEAVQFQALRIDDLEGKDVLLLLQVDVENAWKAVREREI